MEKRVNIVVETDLSYLDLLTKLKDDIESDTCMLKADRNKADKLADELFKILWKYSY